MCLRVCVCVWMCLRVCAFPPTDDHQVQQRLAALPLLQLHLDVDLRPGLPGGTSRSGYDGVVSSHSSAFRGGLGPPGWGLGSTWRARCRTGPPPHGGAADAVLLGAAWRNAPPCSPFSGDDLYPRCLSASPYSEMTGCLDHMLDIYM